MDTKSIIKELGGPETVATLLGVHRTRTYSWIRDGNIPSKHHRAVLNLAREKGVVLSAEDLLPAEGATA